MLKNLIFFVFILSFLSAGCSTAVKINGITQVSTIDALLVGVYDGHMDLKELRNYGDFGIGTFEGLDGEMILLNGKFYKVRADGKIYRPRLYEKTPFACVTKFTPDYSEAISGPVNFKALEEKINSVVPYQNRFCAFILHGDFNRVQTRSVSAQKKPYPALKEVIKNQPVFELLNVRGSLIGFRSPDFIKGLNVPGYHIHFVTDDFLAGGHVLEFEATKGTLKIDTVHDWISIYLPADNQCFNEADLKTDRAEELDSVEK
ncbi:MAG: acetolactate decarboxylase [Candidatus Omnitrophica bacterium]|nr:acetolactate decarboxylase [Candidatus Omnitrophota bacterium]